MWNSSCARRVAAIVLTLGLCGFGTLAAQSREFRIDAAHSSVEFEIPFMYGRVRGRFDDVRGSVLLPDSGTALLNAGAMAVIQAASINTGSAHRDEHLRSPDFFDAERYPAIVFRGDSVSKTKSGYSVAGTLAMHGHTRAVRMLCRMIVAPIHDPHHTVIAVISGSTMIARRDFGIVGGDAHNAWFDKLRSATMGDSVRVALDIHLWAPDASNPDITVRATIARIDSVGIDSAVAALRAAFARDSVAFAGAEGSLASVGDALLARGRVREGFLWLHAMARLLPKSADAMVSVGAANSMMGDSTRAKAWYALAVTADSLNTRAYVQARATRAKPHRPGDGHSESP
jgi:polyisoprenoid-binding protein YceI